MTRPTFAIQNPGDYAIDPQTKAVTLGLVTREGDAINLTMPAEVLAALIATTIEIRAVAIAQGAPAPQGLALQEFQTWETGTNAHKDAVLLVLDKATPKQAAYRVHPRTARELGRALIGLARQAERVRAMATRQ